MVYFNATISILRIAWSTELPIFKFSGKAVLEENVLWFHWSIPSLSPAPIDWNLSMHDDVIKWKHFPRYWPFVWGIPLTKAKSDLCLNKRLSKQSIWRWFETPSLPSWRHGNVGNHPPGNCKTTSWHGNALLPLGGQSAGHQWVPA